MNFDTKKFKEVDNRLTYIIGYRNLYNFVVLFIAGWLLFVTPNEIPSSIQPTVYIGALVIIVLGFKWLLTQIRENIDATDVGDILSTKE